MLEITGIVLIISAISNVLEEFESNDSETGDKSARLASASKISEKMALSTGDQHVLWVGNLSSPSDADLAKALEEAGVSYHVLVVRSKMGKAGEDMSWGLVQFVSQKDFETAKMKLSSPFTFKGVMLELKNGQRPNEKTLKTVTARRGEAGAAAEIWRRLESRSKARLQEQRDEELRLARKREQGCLHRLARLFDRLKRTYDYIPDLPRTKADRTIFEDHMIQVFLFCIVFLYLSLTQYSIAAFDCFRNADGNLYMDDAPLIRCSFVDEPAYRSVLMSGGCVFVFFVCLTPMRMLYLLEVNKQRFTQADPTYVQRYGFMYKIYTPDAPYWELVILLRKTFLVVVVRLQTLYPTVQCVLSVLIYTAIVFLQAKVKPFRQEKARQAHSSITVLPIFDYLLGHASAAWGRFLTVLAELYVHRACRAGFKTPRFCDSALQHNNCAEYLLIVNMLNSFSTIVFESNEVPQKIKTSLLYLNLFMMVGGWLLFVGLWFVDMYLYVWLTRLVGGKNKALITMTRRQIQDEYDKVDESGLVSTA